MSKVLAQNREARFNYEIKDTLEAGLSLLGQEVKSVKLGNASLKGAYVTLRGQEAYLINAYIASYQYAGDQSGYDPLRSRKLLLRRAELKRLVGLAKEQGLAIIPLELYTKKGLVKLKIAVGRGKKKYDKREAIKKREAERKIKRAMR